MYKSMDRQYLILDLRTAKDPLCEAGKAHRIVFSRSNYMAACWGNRTCELCNS
jgi:hypothetical protein